MKARNSFTSIPLILIYSKGRGIFENCFLKIVLDFRNYYWHIVILPPKNGFFLRIFDLRNYQ